MPNYLNTSQVAREIGVHPNTVRLYEARGYIAPVPRSANGYRRFTPLHVEQMRLAHLALSGPYIGNPRVVFDLVKCAAAGDLSVAMELAHQHLSNVRIERTRAEDAIELLDRWVHGQALETTTNTLSIGQAADHLGVTMDQLRNWDRSGLLTVPRDPQTGYRAYGSSEIARLRIIRLLRQSGYSVMAILRMLRQVDAGKIERLREALDTPDPDEDIVTIADRWLTTIIAQEQRAQMIIEQIAVIIDIATNGPNSQASNT